MHCARTKREWRGRLLVGSWIGSRGGCGGWVKGVGGCWGKVGGGRRADEHHLNRLTAVYYTRPQLHRLLVLISLCRPPKAQRSFANVHSDVPRSPLHTASIDDKLKRFQNGHMETCLRMFSPWALYPPGPMGWRRAHLPDTEYINFLIRDRGRAGQAPSMSVGPNWVRTIPDPINADKFALCSYASKSIKQYPYRIGDLCTVCCAHRSPRCDLPCPRPWHALCMGNVGCLQIGAGRCRLLLPSEAIDETPEVGSSRSRGAVFATGLHRHLSSFNPELYRESERARLWAGSTSGVRWLGLYHLKTEW